MVDFHPVFNMKDRSIEIVVKSNKLPPIAIDIPKNNKNRKLFISLFLHKSDILTSKEILTLISDETDNQQNEKLFVTALIYFMRCFQNCRNRVEIDINRLSLLDEENLVVFRFLRKIRNKHYAHDDSDMIKTLDFLLLTSKGGLEYDEMTACVIFNRIVPNFSYLAEKMNRLIDNVILSLNVLIDQVGQEIVDEYKEVPTEKLYRFGLAKMQLPDMDDLGVEELLR